VLCFYFFCPHPHPLRADPRWGRNIESAGEDPFVSGQYAANFVQGFEHATETPYPLQASACCKHFVAVRGARARCPRAAPRAHSLLATRPPPPPPLQNELDGWNGTDRNHIDVFVPQQDLVDSYLPSFQTCVEEGKVSGIMCSACQSMLRPAFLAR
jgi:beta-glucosidase-like glycosyl hydrolase